MPSVEDVCFAFNVTDVEINYSESDMQNLTSYKSFTQHVRPILQKENPKIPAPKLMMLVAAKWREFCEVNPNLQSEQGRSTGGEEAEEPRSSRSSRNEKVSVTNAYRYHKITLEVLCSTPQLKRCEILHI